MTASVAASAGGGAVVDARRRAHPWLALGRKAWLETRTRFATGSIAVLAVCAFMILVHPRMMTQWPIDKIEHPEWHDPPWWDRVHVDYPYFLWHYLYRDMLQKVFMVFAVLLGVGGLTREAAHGTAAFTLALPVSRGRLMATRAIVGAVEILILGLVAAATIIACSSMLRLPFGAAHLALHLSLLVLGALVVLAASLALSSAVEGEHAPALIGLAGVGMLNYLMAPYLDGTPVTGLLRAFDFVRVMGGGEGATAADVPWTALAASLSLGALALSYALRRTAHRDF